MCASKICARAPVMNLMAYEGGDMKRKARKRKYKYDRKKEKRKRGNTQRY